MSLSTTNTRTNTVITNLLLVEDNPVDRRLIHEYLHEVDGRIYQIINAETLETARTILAPSPEAFDAIILDYNLSDGVGLDLIRELATKIAAPMVLLTGFDGRQIDIEAMEAGASDFIPKNGLNSLVLDRTIRYAIERHRNAAELRTKNDELQDTYQKLKTTTAQLEAESANIVRLAEHLAKAPDSSDISFAIEQAGDLGSAAESRIGIWHITPAGATLELSQPMRDMLGLKEGDHLHGQCFWHQFQSDARILARNELKAWSNGTTSSFEVEISGGVGKSESRLVISGCPVWDDSAQISSIMVTAVDVTNRRHAESTIKQQAYRDPLTGLLNRVASDEILVSAISNNKRNGTHLAIFYVDLDDFKTINDTLGHHAGDDLLKQVSGRLRACTRDSDLIVRLGGDEFMVVLNNLHSHSDAANVAQKLLESLHLPCTIDSKDKTIKASIGIAMFPDDSRVPDELIKYADLALYRSKKAGGGMYHFFDEEMRDQADQRRACHIDLISAVDHGGFRLAYQPQISLQGNGIAGVEALIRWDRPDWGMMQPHAFLPIAEETGLIVPIGEWVLRTACAQMVARQKSHREDLRLAINLSARQLRQKDLAASIDNILGETGFAPNLLELEITETCVIDDIDASVKIIDSLRDLGVTISLDDFGTGYSSLSVLKQFAVDCLKIDRSFVNRICENPTDAAIVDSTINLGSRLGFRVVAEGIETQGQLNMLREMGCQEAQGYFFSKPLFTDALEYWVTDFDTDRKIAS